MGMMNVAREMTQNFATSVVEVWHVTTTLRSTQNQGHVVQEEQPQSHVTYESGITPRFALELWVSVRSNSPFQRDRLLKLAWRAKQYPARIPPSFKVRASQKGSAIWHLRTRVGQGNETLLEGGLFDTTFGAPGTEPQSALKASAAELQSAALAGTLMGTANSRLRGELKRRRPGSGLRGRRLAVDLIHASHPIVGPALPAHPSNDTRPHSTTETTQMLTLNVLV